MAGAEAAPRAEGSWGAYLDTFTFQAPKFYEPPGCQEFGRLNDFPPGYAHLVFEGASLMRCRDSESARTGRW
jgi:hypothetical protein